MAEPGPSNPSRRYDGFYVVFPVDFDETSITEQEVMDFIFMRLRDMLRGNAFRENNPTIYMTWETGQHGGTFPRPHVNIVIDDLNRTYTESYVRDRVRSQYSITDVVVRGIQNLGRLLTYITKESMGYYEPSIDDNGDFVPPPAQRQRSITASIRSMEANNASRIEGNSSSKGGAKFASRELMTQKVHEAYEKGIFTVANLHKHFLQMDREKGTRYFFPSFICKQKELMAYLTDLRITEDSIKDQERISNLPPISFGHWFNWVQSQGQRRGIHLMRRFAMFMKPRNPKIDGQTAVVMLGVPRTGKTWSTKWLENQGTFTHAKTKESGVGKYEDFLTHEGVIFDDPKQDELLDDRQTMAAIMTGDVCSLKVFASTKQLKHPIHVVIKANELPADAFNVRSALGRRLDIYKIRDYKDNGRHMPLEYNYKLVCDYLTNAYDDLINYKLPCCCIALDKDAPRCYTRSMDDEVDYMCNVFRDKYNTSDCLGRVDEPSAPTVNVHDIYS